MPRLTKKYKRGVGGSKKYKRGSSRKLSERAKISRQKQRDINRAEKQLVSKEKNI